MQHYEHLEHAIAALKAENERLLLALEEIAKQKIEKEMSIEEHEDADYLGAYESIVMLARKALEVKP
jgi:hypothetical protein